MSQRIRNMRNYARRSLSATAMGKSKARLDAVEAAGVGSADKSEDRFGLENYQRNVTKIQKQWLSKNPDKRQVKILMDLTFQLRRQWIKNEVKSVKAILDMYPCLKSTQVVKTLKISIYNDFLMITLLR